MNRDIAKAAEAMDHAEVRLLGMVALVASGPSLPADRERELKGQIQTQIVQVREALDQLEEEISSS